MRIVADTNVIVSAVIAGGKPRRLIEKSLRGEIELVLSPGILEEVADVLERPKFELAEEAVYRIVGALVQTAHVVDVDSSVQVVEEDPDDDVILNTALDGRADAIVSGDKHLLDLKDFKGIQVHSVAELIDGLEGG